LAKSLRAKSWAGRDGRSPILIMTGFFRDKAGVPLIFALP
jgi:hypothetical protein